MFETLKKIFSGIGIRLPYFWGLIISLIVNHLNLERLYTSFSQPDANGNGHFTYTDVEIHIKETFFATGDAVALWLSTTDLGKFFELDVNNPHLAVSIIISLLCWVSIYICSQQVITGIKYD